MLPHRPVVYLFLQGAQMRQFVDQRFEAIMVCVASDQDSPAARECDSANLPAVHALNDGLAHQKHFPAGRHWVRPNPRPGLPRNFGDVF